MKALIHLLIFFGALQAYFFGLLLFFKKERQGYEWWLLSLLLCLGSMQLLHFLRWEGYLELYVPHLLRTRFLFPAIIGPLFYLFSLAIGNKTITRKTIAVCFLPAAINLILLVPYLMQPASVKQAMQLKELYPLNYYSIYGIARFSLLLFALLTYSSISRNEQTLEWLKKISFILIIHSFILIIINTIDFFFYEIISYYYINLINTMLVFFLGFFTIRYGKIYQEFSEHTTVKGNYEKSGLSYESAALLLNSLETLMTEKHFYRKQGITQREVAEAIGSSTNHLSQALNQIRKEKFTEYLNRYRVEDVKTRIENNEQERFTLLAIAEQSGFGSKASFNTVFRKHTGTTPSEYLRIKVQSNRNSR